MVENTVLRKILANAMKIKGKASWQYFDYECEQWTVPVFITPKIGEQILNDSSIKKVQIIIDSYCL